MTSTWDLERREAHTRSTWEGWQKRLRCYSEQCTLSALPCFKYREGWFVLLRTVVLAGLVGLALICPVVAAVIAFYFILDALLVNTTYVFVTGSPISALRSALLTIFTYLGLVFGFATGWVWLGQDDKGATWSERMIAAVYQSFRTLATVGPENASSTSSANWAKLLVMAELLVGIYFVAIIIAIYASWTRMGRPTS